METLKRKRVFAIAMAFSFLMQTTHVFAEEWYDDNRLVAHALGSIEDKKETNSKEAFLNSWGHGIRVLEADFSMTSDGTLVVRHDFDQDSYYTLEQKVIGSTDMNSSRYQNEKINFRYTPLTAAQLIQMMTEYDDVYIVTDTKSTDIPTIKRQFQAFVDYAKNVEHPEVLERLVIQIYNPEMYEAVKEIHPFKNWIYTLYQTQNPDYDQIAEYCVANGIDVVTINQEIVEPANISKLTQRGIKVYAHTVNRVLDLQKMLNAGCYGIYTDYIKPQDLSFVGLQAVNRKQSMTVEFEENRRQVEGYRILGHNYMPLRDMALLLKDSEQKFAVSYDANKKEILLQKEKDFAGLGNELIVNQEKKQYIEKCIYSLKMGDNQQRAVGFWVDGELFYEPNTLASILGLSLEEEENTYRFISEKE